ncbi:interleukin-1 receptor-like 2 [Aplochiton taeniatus]
MFQYLRNCFSAETCGNYATQFERVYSVPNEGAMLNSTLVSPDVFNHSSVPYNVSWYNPGTMREITNETGRTLVLGELLLFLNVTMGDAGDYVCIVRTPSRCYKQVTKLIVDETSPGQCGRPNTIEQKLTNLVNNDLSCPLTDITKNLKRRLIDYSIRWHKEKDVHLDYTCMAFSFRGVVEQQFTLLPADPNHLVSIGILVTAVVVLFTVSLVIYYLFKIDIVLWLRTTYPYLYRNTELDGKLYDAYVAYPRLFGGETTREVEMFALHTLPQVLEKKCGYKLFIFDRDSQPGQATVDSVEDSMCASRRLILLYTASTFGGSSGSDPARDQELPESGQQYERVAAMHRALLEGSLQVVLVELEEVTPTQLALFPESVRHLRERQGAVCWWKSQRTNKEWSGHLKRRDKNKKEELDISSLCPSSRFWKEMRYHMPVKGKRMLCPEKNALLKYDVVQACQQKNQVAFLG